MKYSHRVTYEVATPVYKVWIGAGFTATPETVKAQFAALRIRIAHGDVRNINIRHL